jgi:eukaryotic-like serine/threonine-protein kinase
MIFKFVNKKIISLVILFINITAVFYLSGCSAVIKLKAPLQISAKSWTTYGSNIFRNNRSAYELTLPLNPLWEYSGSSGISPFSPVMADSTLFIGFLNGEMHALNISKGKKTGNLNLESAINGAPVIERNTVYIPLANSEYALKAYDLTDGKLKWKKKIGGIETSPLVIGQNIYVAPIDGEVQCLDKISSLNKWKFKAPKEIHSTPASDSTMLVFGCDDGYLYSLSLFDGSLCWKYNANSPIFSVPLIENGKVFFGSNHNQYYCLNSIDGLPEWNFTASAPVKSGSALSDSSVYFASVDGVLYSLNINNGKLNWTFKAKSVICTAPTISGKYILISSYDKKVYILEKESGKMAWEHEFEGRVKTSPVFWNGYLIVCYEDYYISVFKSE